MNVPKSTKPDILQNNYNKIFLVEFGVPAPSKCGVGALVAKYLLF